ncbi:EGH1 [Symbiodinium sp. CCMP2456]|nr:EGH1 [Symbiodinium sp. CCMP2456]
MLQLATSSWTSCSASSPQPVGVRRGGPRVSYIKPICSHAGVACAAAASLCGRADLRRRRRSERFGSAQPVVERAPLPSSGRLRIEGSHFADDNGRIVIPKGINFSGLSKVPLTPNGATHIRGPQFYEHREVSFVGRPCSLEDLDMHLQRLTDWGFNLLRLLVTWEAVEHAGPGIYDGEYLQFIARVCERAADYGFWIVIDPHQDCWSRWTGGDGAPGWTLEAAGFHIGPALHTSGAAFLHQENGDPLPSMSWPSNYDRLACATMFSLFWAGDRIAPSVTSQVGTGDASLQQLLQDGFINAMVQIARSVKHVPSVLGFETMNEPHPGWLGRSDFTKAQFGAVSAGQSPLEQLQRCAPGEGSPWASSCLWAQAGVWDPLSQELLDASSFECDWLADCFAPFVTRFAEKVVGEMPHALIGVCPPAFGKEGQQPFPEKMPAQAFWAPHFYDGVVLVGKTWTPAFGIEETKPGTTLLGGLLPAPPIVPVFGLQERLASYKRQLEQKCRLASQETASMLGEIGVPFDIQSPGMTTRDALSQAIDVHMRALEELLLPYCWWNYTPENCKARGDGWNGEDLSILGEGGGRALDAIVRPCLIACAGKPAHQAFNLQERRFECEFDADIGETIFFIPSRHFKPDNAILSVTPGTHVVWNVDLQSLLCRTDRTGRVAIDLRQKESK